MSAAKDRVTLFIPCLVDAAAPSVAEATASVLERIGCRLDCPADQTCCGQPAFNAGHRKAARTAAKRFVEIFEGADTIVCPSGSCVAMVRHGYPQLFAGDPRWRMRAEALAAKTFELSQFLVDVAGVTDVGARCRGTFTYHDSCHLMRSLGVSEQPRRLIGRVRGARLVEMFNSDRCCGFGGAFSVHYPEISTAMVDDKVDNILATGADAVVGCDMGCLMNIEGRLSRRGASVRVLHLAELLNGAAAG
jgi:L-lactate dehydrogenase complex protein LldE